MATASGSKTLRKSCLKRRSCYDDFGDKDSNETGKPDGSKKQRPSTLQMRSTPFPKSDQTTKRPSDSKLGLQDTIEIEDDDEPVIVSDLGKPENVDSSKAVGHRQPMYRGGTLTYAPSQSEAFVILVHTFNPESISEVTVGQAFHSLEKANEGVADLFRRVKPEFVDLVIDIGVANEFDEGGDTHPDVRKRVTASGRAAYLWHTEEGRGELSVHRIVIE